MTKETREIFVTGGAGFIGSAFVRMLLKEADDSKIINFEGLEDHRQILALTLLLMLENQKRSSSYPERRALSCGYLKFIPRAASASQHTCIHTHRHQRDEVELVSFRL